MFKIYDYKTSIYKTNKLAPLHNIRKSTYIKRKKYCLYKSIVKKKMLNKS